MFWAAQSYYTELGFGGLGFVLQAVFFLKILDGKNVDRNALVKGVLLPMTGMLLLPYAGIFGAGTFGVIAGQMLIQTVQNTVVGTLVDAIIQPTLLNKTSGETVW